MIMVNKDVEVVLTGIASSGISDTGVELMLKRKLSGDVERTSKERRCGLLTYNFRVDGDTAFWNLRRIWTELSNQVPSGLMRCLGSKGLRPVSTGKNKTVSTFFQFSMLSVVGNGWNAQCSDQRGCSLMSQYSARMYVPSSEQISDKY